MIEAKFEFLCSSQKKKKFINPLNSSNSKSDKFLPKLFYFLLEAIPVHVLLLPFNSEVVFNVNFSWVVFISAIE